MLSNEEFTRQSIDLNLFFMRIMMEHMFFMQAAFTPKNQNLIRRSDALKGEAARILSDTVSISNGIVSPEAVASGEIVTVFTLEAERTTQFYTGINIDTGITQAEIGLSGGRGILVSPAIVQRIRQINQRAINLVTLIIAFKERVLNDVLRCNLYTNNYPLLIDHILREARLYLNLLIQLQSREEINSENDLINQEIFWNRIMAEHAKFIRGLLDPTEVDLFNKANMFGNTFDRLTAEAMEAQRQIDELSEVAQKSLAATREIREFKRQGTEGLLNCKIKSIILPLLGDHTLREASHFLRLLSSM